MDVRQGRPLFLAIEIEGDLADAIRDWGRRHPQHGNELEQVLALVRGGLAWDDALKAAEESKHGNG